MKAKILVSLVSSFVLSLLVFMSCYEVASANSSSEKLDVQNPIILVQVTFENGNCEGVFVQIKNSSGSVVLQGYTTFVSGNNQVWWLGTIPFGEYVAIAYYNGSFTSSSFKWEGGNVEIPLHFNSYAECGDE